MEAAVVLQELMAAGSSERSRPGRKSSPLWTCGLDS